STQDDSVDPFTAEELHKLFKVAASSDPKFHVMLRMWVQTGMRHGEAVAIQPQDLDLPKFKAHVSRTFNPGGQKLSTYTAGPTKNPTSRRIVNLCHPISENTSEWRPNITDESMKLIPLLRALTKGLAPDAYIFSDHGTQPWSPHQVRTKWANLLRAADVRSRVSEQLRHSWASHMLSRNAPITHVTKQGGWKNPHILLRVYARWIEQALPATDLPVFGDVEIPEEVRV